MTEAISKAAKRAQKRAEKAQKQAKRNPKPLQPMNDSQKFYMECLQDEYQIFAIGGAGTGKTYIASRHALKQLIENKIEKVIISRPTVAKAKHKQGYLPGTIEEKMKPWLIPLIDAFKAEAAPSVVDRLLDEQKIEFLPFEHMRGRSINNAVIILDEAQNCDYSDLRLFLTRIGKDSQVIICGDTDQKDIADSGLEEIVRMVELYGIDAAIVEFGEEDVVRSKIAKEWVAAFKRHSGV